MRTMLAALVAVVVACSALVDAADPTSDAPETRVSGASLLKEASSYNEALGIWRSAEDVNAWIGAKFQYDMSRALQLSETQRQQNGRLPIYPPETFFSVPSGVCVDLARFAVETLGAIAPQAKPRYVMIEFDPLSIAGNTLRRHWVASFERAGKLYFFADSKRPGHIAGPYESTPEFISEYAQYRGRAIVAFSEMESYERKARTRAVKQNRDASP
jgi:hypothetical protein